jgi:hypothetical protein
MTMMDMLRLTAEEFGLLEKLLKKASGELEGDAVPTFRIERVFVDGNTKNDGDAD